MPFYRYPDNPVTGYFMGTLVLSLLCVITGEYSISAAFRLNKKNILRNNNNIDHFQDLSIKALKRGDKALFKACNSVANDAYGKAFFSQIALSASSLWPVFIALGWMQYRFSSVEFGPPFSVSETGYSYGYLATFIFCYILVRFITLKCSKILSIHGASFYKRKQTT
jgi:hypothetical protein